MVLLVCLRILYVQEAANFSWLSATSPAWGHSIYKHFLYPYLLLSLNDGVSGNHSPDSAEAAAFAGCQKDQRSSPGTEVPAGHGTPSSSSRPEDARWGAPPHKSHSVLSRQPHPPRGGGRRRQRSGALLPSLICPVALGAAGRFERSPAIEVALGQVPSAPRLRSKLSIGSLRRRPTALSESEASGAPDPTESPASRSKAPPPPSLAPGEP